MTQEEMIEKVFDTFITKYGKPDLTDAVVVLNYANGQVSRMKDINDKTAERIADEAYKRIRPEIMDLKGLFTKKRNIKQ